MNRPKRRKSKDNPYMLKELGNNEYTISFFNGRNELVVLNIDEKIFRAFDRFELDDLKQLNEIDNHRDFRTINNSEENENIIYNTISNSSKSVEEIVEDKIINEELYNAINSLNDIQKDRIKKYYFENKTLEEIAKEEDVVLEQLNIVLMLELIILKIKLNFRLQKVQIS